MWASEWVGWFLSVELEPSSALERFRMKAEELYAQQCGGDSVACGLNSPLNSVDPKDEL